MRRIEQQLLTAVVTVCALVSIDAPARAMGPGGACCPANGGCVMVASFAECNALGGLFAPGLVCGDGDGDGCEDICVDACPGDPNKCAPGICGCGVSDSDSDGDGVPNCFDGCPTDPNKTEPGICGCDVPDFDSDGDSVPDCNDVCFGQDDTIDANGNGIPDCLDFFDAACCLPDQGCVELIHGYECEALGGCIVAQCLGDHNGNGVDDICDAECKIPTLGEWGLIVLALSLLAAAKVRFGRVEPQMP